MQFAQSSLPCQAIRIGGITKSALLEQLAAAQVEINSAGQQLFSDERFRTAPHPEVVRVHQVSVAGLGLERGGVMSQIMAAAAERGLSYCPLELAPHLRLLLLDQDEGAIGFPHTQHKAPPGSITVISPPLCDEDEVPKGFYLRRIEGKMWLRGYTSWAGHVWQPEDLLVFSCAQSAA
jgi:hypothetical protein